MVSLSNPDKIDTAVPVISLLGNHLYLRMVLYEIPDQGLLVPDAVTLRLVAVILGQPCINARLIFFL